MFYKEIKDYLNYWMSEESASTLSFIINAALMIAVALIIVAVFNIGLITVQRLSQ